MKNWSEGGLEKATSCDLEGHGHRTDSHDLVGSPQALQEQTCYGECLHRLFSMGMRLKAEWLESLSLSAWGSAIMNCDSDHS